MTTDLMLTAAAQLGAIMAADWPITEAVGNYVPVSKFWISLLVAAILSTLAYWLGWFTALPAVAAGGAPLVGVKAYLSAAFAGAVTGATLSAGHFLVKAATSAAPADPPNPGAAGGAT